jgi:hypothetical protein
VHPLDAFVVVPQSSDQAAHTAHVKDIEGDLLIAVSRQREGGQDEKHGRGVERGGRKRFSRRREIPADRDQRQNAEQGGRDCFDQADPIKPQLLPNAGHQACANEHGVVVEEGLVAMEGIDLSSESKDGSESEKSGRRPSRETAASYCREKKRTPKASSKKDRARVDELPPEVEGGEARTTQSEIGCEDRRGGYESQG